MKQDISLEIVNELLTTATHLYKKHNKSEVDLRRAISTAYYALYHFLIIEAVNSFCKHLDHKIKIKLCRNFEHSALKDVCVKFREEITKYEIQQKLIEDDEQNVILSKDSKKPYKGQQHKPIIGKMLGQMCNIPIPTEIKEIITTFPTMQEMRHSADYDLTWCVDEFETERHIKKVEQTIKNWKLSNNQDKQMLLLFLFGKIRN